MFDCQQLSPLHTIRQEQSRLRPDIMRREHIECLRRRDAQKCADLWQSAWQATMKLAESIAVYVGNSLLSWVEERKLRLQSDRA